jgi:hypothetical protein
LVELREKIASITGLVIFTCMSLVISQKDSTRRRAGGEYLKPSCLPRQRRVDYGVLGETHVGTNVWARWKTKCEAKNRIDLAFIEERVSRRLPRG